MSDFFDKCNDHFFVAAYKMGSDTHQKNDLVDFVSNPYEHEIIYDVQNELCDLSFEDKSERGLTMQEVSNCVNRRVLKLISEKIHEVMSGPDSPFIVREEELDSGYVPYELYDASYELFGDYDENQIPSERDLDMMKSIANCIRMIWREKSFPVYASFIMQSLSINRSCPEPSATSTGKVPELFWNMS